jgi:hypothetical protein
MSNAFTNFLGTVATGFLGGGYDGDVRDYQHANRLYVQNNYDRSPKVGFLYFVNFNVNKDIINKLDPSYIARGLNDVGFLVKRAELPKFKISTDTLNQYNRKTVVQTKITYSSVNIDFHDDNGDATTNLWKNYYNYYYVDGKYGQTRAADGRVLEFTDTKYGITDYAYGLDNFQNVNFFDSIDIYVLHKKRFTQITLINPKISDWTHDTLDQGESNKILSNKMTLDYEAVVYRQGRIKRSEASGRFAAVYYDNTPSPLKTGGGLLGAIAGANDIFGEDGTLANAKSPLDFIGAGLQAIDLAKNVRQLNKSGLRQEGYSILGGVLGNISSSGNQPGGVRNNINTGLTIAGTTIQETFTKARAVTFPRT